MSLISPTQIISAHKRALALFDDGKHAQGIALLTDVVQGIRGLQGPRSTTLEECLTELGAMLEVVGEVKRAEAAYSEALDIRRYVAGEKDPSLLPRLQYLARARMALGLHDSAETLLRECLGIYEAKSAEIGQEVMILPLRDLAGVMLASGRPRQANELIQRGLQLSEEAKQDELKAARLNALQTLANAQQALHLFMEAGESLEQALELSRSLHGSGSGETVSIIENLAEFYESMGHFKRATELRQQAADVVRTVTGIHSSETRQRVALLANVLAAQGNRDESLRLLEFVERPVAALHHCSPGEWALLMTQTAQTLCGMNDYADARDRMMQAAAILRKLDPSPLLTLGRSLWHLSAIHAALHEIPAALAAVRESLSCLERSDLQDATTLAEVTSTFCDVLLLAGEHDAARTAADQVFELTQADAMKKLSLRVKGLSTLAGWHRYTGGAAELLNLLEQAMSLVAREIGRDHLLYLEAVSDAAPLHAAAGQADKAAAAFHRLQVAELRQMMRSRRRGELLIAEFERTRGNYYDAITLALEQRDRPDLAIVAFNTAVLGKPGVFDALALPDTLRYEWAHPVQARAFDQLRRSAHLIARFDEGPEPDEDTDFQRQHTRALSDEIRLEESLAAEVPEYAALRRSRQVDARSLARALPPNGALLEYVYYLPADFDAVEARGEHYWQPARYCAMLLQAGESGSVVQMADLGPAEEIEAQVARALEGDEQSDRKLSDLLAEPLRPALQGVEQVMVVPDGELVKLSPVFFSRAIGGSARCILAAGDIQPMRPGPTDRPVVLANPDLDHQPASAKVERRLPRPVPPWQPPLANAPLVGRVVRWLTDRFSRNDPATIDFDTLAAPVKHAQVSHDLRKLAPIRSAGRQQEATRIAELLNAERWEGQKCAGEHLLRLHAPRVLHIAAPWFALADEPWDAQAERQRSMLLASARREGQDNFRENPMVRAGVLLTGANAVMAGQRPGRSDADGILTALAISGMDLSSTQLVVLSNPLIPLPLNNALALRSLLQGFFIAGARAVVLRLTPLAETETLRDMETFYGLIARGIEPADAFAQAFPEAGWTCYVRPIARQGE